MNTLIKSSAVLLVLGLASSTLLAQQTPPPPKPEINNNDNIVIRKKGGSNEKITIVIDGDKVTVNGKPVDEFKNDNVEISRGDDGDEWKMNLGDMGGVNVMGGGMDKMRMYGDLMKEFHGNKAFLGVMTEKTDDGAKITDVTDESAAAKAGLKEGDIITKIGDDKIATSDDLYKAIGKHNPDEKVNITYKRDGKEATTTATLGKNNDVHAYSFNYNKDGKPFNFAMPRINGGNGFIWEGRPHMGLQVQDTEDGKGVKVLDVDDESPAEKAGLKEDDIITMVNGKAVNSVDELKTAVKDAKAGDTFKLSYLRNNQAQSADVKFPKELKTTDL